MFPGLTYIDYCQSILKYDYCWLVCNPVMLLSSIILIIQFGPICVNVYITSILEFPWSLSALFPTKLTRKIVMIVALSTK